MPDPLPAMKQRGWGRIINMGSIYSTRAVADRIDYVTTKTAIVGMTRAVAIETTRSGITCNALCPGTRSILPSPPHACIFVGHTNDFCDLLRISFSTCTILGIISPAFSITTVSPFL